MYDFDANVLLYVYSYLVFAGNGWLELVPKHLPHFRVFCLAGCYNVCDVYVEVLMAALPELEVTR
jgi:hypothetical protein